MGLCRSCDALREREGDQGLLCASCRDMRESQLGGGAMLRGERWGASVASRMGTRRAAPRWPRWEDSERVREVARRKVRDLSGDLQLRERLAQRCATSAAKAYESKRKG